MTTTEIEPFPIPTLPVELLETPLDYIVADHDRHRALCGYLKRVARRHRIDGESASGIARFFREDLKHHFEDERLSLFPVLRQRSSEDEEFIRSIRQIEQGHAKSEAMIEEISGAMARIAMAKIASEPEAEIAEDLSGLLETYIGMEEASLAFENSVIMVIAEVRLKKSDIDRMRTGMKARRGVAG